MGTNESLRIFLAGASGVIGQHLMPRLVQAGHVVGGLTRSPGKVELLEQLGAEPILCDVFDLEVRVQAVRDFKPDVVLSQLADLPDDVTRIPELTDLNARIRTEGTRNLLEAARCGGARRVLAPWTRARVWSSSSTERAEPGTRSAWSRARWRAALLDVAVSPAGS
jgi:nucleoside-diphosphate-sugar epimerase